MTREQKANELATTLRQCAERGGCRGCPLDDYVGCCTDRLKQEAAEMIEDQQAVIRFLAARLGGMTASIKQLRDKYAGEGKHGKAEEIS